MESVYHIITIRVNETSWAHVWRLHFCYLGTGYDSGGGSNSLFWKDRWLNGRGIKDIAPVVYDLVPKRIRNKRIVNEAL
jgi:hypothetical protein